MTNDQCRIIDLSEEDVLDAMRSLQGYVDITPGTFREIYQLAYAHASKRMAGAVLAKEIMTAPVLCLRHDMSAAEAAKFLADHGVSGAPVVDAEGKVCGVVSEKDFLRKMGLTADVSFMGVIAKCLHSPGCMVSGLRDLSVDDLMSAPPFTASEEISVSEISALFTEKAINRLPICDAAGRPVGIVTRTDLVGALCA